MRNIERTEDEFHATHKGGEIFIEREDDGRFYIIVKWKDGGSLYDGWAPEVIETMDDAIKEAVRGACL